MSTASANPQQPFDRDSAGHRNRRAAWLPVLIALGFLLGFWLADIHTIGHLGDPSDEDCEICLVAVGLDHAATPSLDWLDHEAPHHGESFGHSRTFHSAPIRAFRSRAPPLTRNA